MPPQTPQPLKMDSSLEDKIAYFQRVSTMNREVDGDDEYDAEEQTHRETCRRFHNSSNRTEARAVSTGVTAGANQAAQPSRSQDTDASDDVQIIKVTPRVASISRKETSKAGKIHAADEEVIPDSVRASNESMPAFLHPLQRSRTTHQATALDETPSKSVGTQKKKKQPNIKLLPEDQQVFRGLSFYYIPNDDASGVRKLQINKAREHGATWVRSLKEASHVIVDQDLTYKDIKSELALDASASAKIIVNASYPTDCVSYRTLLDHSQDKYVRNLSTDKPSTGNSSTHAPSSPQAPSPSVGTKRKRRSLRRGQESYSSSQPDDDEPGKDTTRSKAAGSMEPATLANDELSQYISLVRGNSVYQIMSLEEEDDEASLEDHVIESESQSSDSKRERKKLRSGNRQKGQDSTTSQKVFACMEGGIQGGSTDNPNARTIELLQALADQYEHRDHFRWISYRKAITTLRQQKIKIRTAGEAKKLLNIGNSIADKIEEIINNDRLLMLENTNQQPETIITNMFLKIYGVGINQADKWVAQGYRTLDDLREKAKLTASQKIGIEHFDDLNERIPRWEVEALAEVVREAAARIDASVQFIIGGSYRRGSDSSGDIDLIITKKGTETTQDLLPFLEKLISRLTNDGFLTATLASFSGNTSEGHGSKWHGCCVLPEAAFPKDKGQYRPTWRRIDLLLVPESELGAALIYFTGNDIFNRSIRQLAYEKKMRLNQRGLFMDVVRGPGRAKHTKGELLEGRDEKRIFELLGVIWREPKERWC